MNCNVDDCQEEATFQVTEIASRRIAFEKYLCDAHAGAFLDEFRASVVTWVGQQACPPSTVAVDLETVIYHNAPEQFPASLWLHEVGGSRRFGLMVSGWAWWAMSPELKHAKLQIPLTHAAWSETIRQLGATLQEVVLDRRDGEDWWTAELRLAREGGLTTVAVRASDAIILSLHFGTPICVLESALEKFADRGAERSELP